jgi:hypothetical protein
MTTITKKIDYNSSVNQRIKEKFVSQHVQANVNSMVEYILNKSSEDSNAPFSLDDVENMYSYPEYYGEYAKFEGGTGEQRDAEIERLHGLISDNDDTISGFIPEKAEKEIEELETQNEAIQSEIEELENLDQESQDVYEWWLVSSYLCAKLVELGHPVLKDENIWGRCTTGQAILLDYAISKICEGMKILEGQSNSWAE